MPDPLPDPSRFAAALFDMDGVVIDSEPLSARIMKKAAKTFGIDVPDEAMPSFKGLPGDVVYGRIAAEFGHHRVDGAEIRRVRDRMYEEALPDVELMPGLRTVLDRLTSRDWPMALVTSSRRRHAETVLAAHGLGSYFPVILGSEDVVRPKPAPDPYRAAAERVGIPPAACFAVEDSVNGIRSAVAAGCFVVGFGTEFPEDDLYAAGAGIVCRDHAEFAGLIVA